MSFRRCGKRFRGTGALGGFANLERRGLQSQRARALDRLESATEKAALDSGGQQQPVSDFARAPALSQSGLASAGHVPPAAQRGLAGALAPYAGLNQGLGVYLWPIIVGTVIGTIVAAIWIRIKRKEEQQRSAQELKP